MFYVFVYLMHFLMCDYNLSKQLELCKYFSLSFERKLHFP